jgi:hypothetical protein
MLPTVVEGLNPEVVPLSQVIGALTTPLWLITHPELKRAMRVHHDLKLQSCLGACFEGAYLNC